MSEPKEHRKLAAIMFTDMVGFSALAQHNEALALELLREHALVLQSVFARYNGKTIKTIGDAFCVEFPSALAAARCAIDIQLTLFTRNENEAESKRIHVRIGLHLGDVVERDNTIFGDGVNIAARIQPLAQPGGICLSEDVARQIQNKLDVPLQKLGQPELKNIKRPINIYCVVLPWEKRPPSRLPLSGRQKKIYSSIAAGTVGVIAVLFFIWPLLSKAPDAKIESVAVLPFRNLSAEPNTDYYAQGLTLELSKNLRHLPYLTVIPFTVSAESDSQRLDYVHIARSMKVHGAVRGTVLKRQNAFSIFVELIDLRTNKQLWSQRYDRSRSEIFATMQEIISRLSILLEIPVTNQPQFTSYATTNPEAYDAYLRGLFHAKQSRKNDNTLAMEYYSQALSHDSSFLPARTALADAQEFHYERRWDVSESLLREAERNCRIALAKDSTNAHALAVLGAVEAQRGNTEISLALYMKALQYDEQNQLALTRVATFYLNQDPAKAITYFQRLQTINPTSWIVNSNLGIGYAQLKNYSQAIRSFQRAIELNPDQASSWINLGYLYERVEQYDSAMRCYRTALRKDPQSPPTYEGIITLLLAQGKYDAAAATIIEGLKVLPSNSELLYALGLSYRLAGYSDKAEKSFQEGLLLVQQKIRKNPAVADNIINAGLFHARLNHPAQAISLARNALRLDEANSELYIKQARIYAILGMEEEMLEAFKRAKALNPEFDKAYVATGPDFEQYRDDPRLLALARSE